MCMCVCECVCMCICLQEKYPVCSTLSIEFRE